MQIANGAVPLTVSWANTWLWTMSHCSPSRQIKQILTSVWSLRLSVVTEDSSKIRAGSQWVEQKETLGKGFFFFWKNELIILEIIILIDSLWSPGDVCGFASVQLNQVDIHQPWLNMSSVVAFPGAKAHQHLMGLIIKELLMCSCFSGAEQCNARNTQRSADI